MAWYENFDRGTTPGFTLEWQLSGRNAVCEPGRAIIARFLPHPDVAAVFGPDDTENGNYDEVAKSPFVRVNTHWYTDSSGLRRRVFCTRTAPEFIGSSECDLCRLGVKLDRRLAVNAYIANIDGRLVADQNGLPQVRIMLVSRRIFDDIMSMMTGQFGVGDITHPLKGRHVSMTRPRNQLEPWRLKPEPRPSRLMVPNVADFLRSLSSVEDILSKAFKSQRIEAIDIEATLGHQSGSATARQGHGNDQTGSDGTNWFDT